MRYLEDFAAGQTFGSGRLKVDAARVKSFVKTYRWKGPLFAVAAVNGEGCREAVFAIQDWLDAHPAYAPAQSVASEAIDSGLDS